MHWDWQVFCNSTLSGEATACFGAAGDITYLQWMISAWGWTASVAALGFVIALFFGVMVGIARTLPLAPLVLALVLGDMAETSFRQSMLISKGSLDIFL